MTASYGFLMTMIAFPLPIARFLILKLVDSLRLCQLVILSEEEARGPQSCLDFPSFSIGCQLSGFWKLSHFYRGRQARGSPKDWATSCERFVGKATKSRINFSKHGACFFGHRCTFDIHIPVSYFVPTWWCVFMSRQPPGTYLAPLASTQPHTASPVMRLNEAITHFDPDPWDAGQPEDLAVITCWSNILLRSKSFTG